MTFETLNFAAIGPEILLLVGACSVLMVSVFSSTQRTDRNFEYVLSSVVLLSAVGLVLVHFGDNLGSAFHGHFYKDTMGDLLKLLVYAAVLASFHYSKKLRRMHEIETEFLVLGLFAVLGMSVMASAGSFVTLFLGLELFSLPLYTMVALERGEVTETRAAMNSFVYGAVATGIFLYGMSLLYGATGSLNLLEISTAVNHLVSGSLGQSQLFLVSGTVLLIVGISFKFGSLPDRMWIVTGNEVPVPVVFYLGVMPKLVAFVMMIRILVGTLDPLVGQWQQMVAVFAFLSVAAGGYVSTGRKIKQSEDVLLGNL